MTEHHSRPDLRENPGLSKSPSSHVSEVLGDILQQVFLSLDKKMDAMMNGQNKINLELESIKSSIPQQPCKYIESLAGRVVTIEEKLISKNEEQTDKNKEVRKFIIGVGIVLVSSIALYLLVAIFAGMQVVKPYGSVTIEKSND